MESLAKEGLGFIGGLAAIITTAMANAQADEATVKAAMEKHVGDFLSKLRDGGEFDHRHETALAKLDAAIAAAKARVGARAAVDVPSAAPASSDPDEITKP